MCALSVPLPWAEGAVRHCELGAWPIGPMMGARPGCPGIRTGGDLPVHGLSFRPMNPEATFVRAFLKREKWARCLQLLPDRKRREEILVHLNAKLGYVAAFAQEVPEDQDHPEALEHLLLDMGAPAACHVLAYRLPLDGREVPLREALRAVCLHEHGSVLVCVPGSIGLLSPCCAEGRRDPGTAR